MDEVQLAAAKQQSQPDNKKRPLPTHNVVKVAVLISPIAEKKVK
jgi:hypothetical protein